MSADYAASVQAVGLRIAKLDTAGAPVVGSSSCYVTKAFTRFSWTPEYEQGEEIITVAGDGSQCVYFKMDDTLKQVTIELEICKPQPEIHEILNGGTLLGAATTTVTVTNKALTSNVATLTTGTAHGFVVGDTVIVAGVDSTFNGTYVVTVVGSSTTFSYAKTAANVTSTSASGTAGKSETLGWAMPEIGSIATPNGVSIEVWSRAIVAGKPAAVNPYWRWVTPYVKTRLEGDRTLENGALASVFSGVGYGNTGFADGPADDWDFTSASALAYARDATAPTTEGYITVA